MQVDIKAIPNARKNLIKRTGKSLKVYVTAPACNGKANKAVIELLAEDFKVAKNKITIIKGLKSRHKTIIINGV